MTDSSIRGSWIIAIDDIMSSTGDDDVVSFRKPWGEDATVQLAYHDISDTFSIVVNEVPLTQEGEYFLSLQGRQLKSILMYNWRSRKELRLETDDDYVYLRSVYQIEPLSPMSDPSMNHLWPSTSCMPLNSIEDYLLK